MEEDSARARRLKRISDLDNTIPSPESRSQYIYAKLQELNPKPTMWDLACFSAEFLGMLSLMEPSFKDVSSKLLAILYEAHYTHERDLASCLLPSMTQPKKTQSSGAPELLASMELTPE